MLFYALTIFLSSFLLFQVQPVIAKMILPWFGGSAAVWNTCMLFFQAVLLGGYTYAHLLFERARPRRQAQIHITLLAVSLLTLPILPGVAWKPQGEENPVFLILGLLAATIGLPYFLLSTTGPLLQAWYTRTRGGTLPYRLFALSNAASLIALITYPTLVEPRISLQMQAWIWSACFVVFVLLCAFLAWTAREAPAAAPQEIAEPGPPPATGIRLLWIGLAACPSILMLTVTSHLTQDVASVPLLWILPLVLYLLSFILCFESTRLYWRWFYLCLMFVSLLTIGWLNRATAPPMALRHTIVAYAVAFFACAMVCHGELASWKPHPRYLTSFYVSLSVGGVLGGLFVGLLAPIYFDSFLEFPFSWCLAGALAVTAVAARYNTFFRQREGIAALALLIIGLGTYANWWIDIAEQQQSGYRSVQRNFYGMLRVQDEGDFVDQSRVRKLLNGVINHGQQYLHPFKKRDQTTYYCLESGAGRALLSRREGSPQKVGVIGLGTGTLVSYGRSGDEYHLYEINPLVIHLAEAEFTFLSDSPARKQIHLGDARLTLEKQPPMQYDVLLVDAFSGDAIPIHLLTREAFQLYLRHLKPTGILAIHTSNKYLQLEPVVAGNAADLHLQSITYDDKRPLSDETCFSSTWVLLFPNTAKAEHQSLRNHGKLLLPVAGFRSWNDNFSNLWSIFKEPS